MCKYKNKKNAEAPLECIFRINHPYSTSRLIESTDINATFKSDT